MILQFKNECDNPVVVNFNLVETWEICNLGDGLGIEFEFSSGRFLKVNSCLKDIRKALNGDVVGFSRELEVVRS
jgi:hypothetical protein